MTGMFDSLSAITFNQPIGAWNTGAVTTMNGMFANAIAFNQPIGSWNTGAVINMQSMFNNAYAFNQNLTGWDVDQVTSYSGFRTGSGLTIENTPVLFR
jgi:surface protein